MVTAASLDVTALAGRLRAVGCVFADAEADLLAAATPDAAVRAALVARRISGEPLEHVLGWAEFCGIRIGVEPGVFVPRRRSELLVREAVARTPPAATVVDACCGSGAIGHAVATARPGIDLSATDLDPVAVRCARRNLAEIGARVLEGDLYDPLPRRLAGRVDVVTVNAPYVPTAAIAVMPPEARDHEPRVALDGGQDGLDLHRRLAAEAPFWLAPGGSLIIETSERQSGATAAIAARAGLAARVVTCSELDATAVVATLPA